MTDSNIYTGTNTLTDNWLFQSIADFLSGKSDPSDNWGWISSDALGVYDGSVKAGAIYIDSLTTLLEQILFANNIYLLEEWIPSWYSQNTELNKIYSPNQESIIKTISLKDINIQSQKDSWLKSILITNKLREKYLEGMEMYERGENNFWSQVINGIADYISISSVHNFAYSPHPVRKRFLKSNIWYVPNGQEYPFPGIRTFNNLINRKKISLSTTRGSDSLLTNLNVKIPSGALFCIQESSNTLSPISIALQLRNETEIKSIRIMIHELSMAMVKRNIGDKSNDIELINLLEDDIEKASVLLKGRKTNVNGKSYESQIIKTFNYERYSNQGIIHKGNTLEHSGFLMDLIDTGSIQVRQMLENKLNIKDHLVFNHLLDWYNPRFLKNVRNPEEIVIYKIHSEMNGDIQKKESPKENVVNYFIVISQTIYQIMTKMEGTKNNPWISGSFYLFTGLSILTLLAVISNKVPWYLFPIIVIGGILITGLIGFLQLINDEELKEASFLTLIKETYKRLPLLRNTENRKIQKKS